MTVAELNGNAEVQSGSIAEVLAELRTLNEKMDRVERVIDAVTRRMEDLEEMSSDMWPMVHGVTQGISRKLHEMEQNGTLAFLTESARVAQHVTTSLTADEVRALGENAVGTLHTVGNLMQPEVRDVADRAAAALRASKSGTPKKISLWKAMRDPEIRRGMTLLLTVLREMGHEGYERNKAAVAATAAQ